MDYYSIILILILLLHSSSFLPTTSLQIGALLLHSNSTITNLANHAMHLALRHINQHNGALGLPKLHLHILHTNCDPLDGAAAAMELFSEEVVAIAGPECSTAAYFVAHMASYANVPLVSFGATDPTLSERQYSYFLRVAHDDAFQMAAIATLVKRYGWTQVVALHSDDDYGTNGIDALRNALEKLELLILQQTAIPPGLDKTSIRSILSHLKAMETPVFIVHMQADMGLTVISEAHDLGMMATGFAWIVTDMIATTLGMMVQNPEVVNLSQGVVGIRPHISDSPQLQYFFSEWGKMAWPESGSDGNLPLINAYGLYAYDAVWLISHAIDKYVRKGGSFQFEDQPKFPTNAGGTSELSRLKRFKGGSIMKELMLQTKFNGTSGIIELDQRGDRIGINFEIVNMVSKGLRTVGYLTRDYDDISLLSADDDQRAVLADQSGRKNPQSQLLLNIIWPGGSRTAPGGVLRIGVPKKTGFLDVLGVLTSRANNGTAVIGLCIDIFVRALSSLPYNFSLTYIPYGNGSNPDYDDLIELLAEKKFDAVVGDVTITTKRLELVDFTLPFLESGLVVLVPKRRSQRWTTWSFLVPFSLDMWATTVTWFVFAGSIIWVLEHRYRNHEHDPKTVHSNHNDARTDQNKPHNPKADKKRGGYGQDHYWYIITTLVFPESDRTKTALGRIVIGVWIVIAFIIQSSYTANLTSILTTEQLSPPITGIDSLVASDSPIGYQAGSFVKEYLIQLKVKANRLKPLTNRTMFAEALNQGAAHGGVAAIVDERSYVDLFLATYCGFTIAGQEFTRTGWGFAFPKGSRLSAEMSKAILNMSGSGELEKIHDFWYRESGCGDTTGNAAPSMAPGLALGVSRFRGVVYVWLGVTIICVIIHVVGSFVRFISTRKRDSTPGPKPDSTPTPPASWGKLLKEFCKHLFLHNEQQQHVSK